MKDFLSRYGMWVLVALLAIVLVSVFTCSQADAREWYVKTEVGTTFDTQVQTSFGGTELTDELTYGAYVGTSVGPVRVEAGASHIAGNINLGGIALEASAIDYNATAYLDLATSDSSGFFIGGGVDYIQAEASLGPFFSTDLSGYGYHVSGGYATRVTENAIFELQARYLVADLDNVDLTGTAVTAAVRWAL